ncbi:hypothetical protein [Bacillus tequilensis]|uniref:Uncharacterized protein n=1 Tax=Bacillus tequilensis TaxID=227866 RepID=A0A6H0WKT2_9BACI|nr:hypothetical protein [Bacillus tequilensis]QIW79966.1 hypothetical protein G4P54_09195 [Bacillus tequilensis]
MFNKSIIKRNLVEMKSRDLIKFIRQEFPVKGQNYTEHMEKYETLKKLSENDLSSGISRMARIETSFDNSKNAALLVMIFNFLIGFLKLCIGAGVELNNFSERVAQSLNLAYGFFTTFFIAILFVGLLLDKNKVTTASFFKTLLEQAKADKEKEHKSSNDKLQFSDNTIEIKLIKRRPFWKKNVYNRQAKNLEEILLKWSDEEIIEYIRINFGYLSEKNKKAELQRIRGLEYDTIILGIGRMKEMEETSDNSKIIPGFTSASIFLISQFIYFATYGNKGAPTLTSVCLALASSVAIFFGVTWGMDKGRTHRSGATLFRSLLEQVKSEMEKK